MSFVTHVSLPSTMDPHKRYPVIESFDQVLSDLESFVTIAQATYPIDPNRQFFVGFSQGAILSMSLALRMGSKLRGIVALHGYIPQHIQSGIKADDFSKLSVLITQGETDPMFPPEIGQQNEALFKQVVSDVTYRVYRHGHSVSGQEAAQLMEWLRDKAQTH